MKNLILLLTLVVSSVGTLAAETGSKLDSKLNSLGGNKELLKKAQAMEPRNRFRVVQKRAVDRTWRLEVGANYGFYAGGDPYVDTSSYGGFFDLHINPKWSVGARHYENRNSLSSEGKRVFDEAEKNGSSASNYIRPDIDYPLSSTMGVVSFYPIYGKLNLFDTAVSQFDLYVLGGAGQVKLSSGSAPTWTAGGGVGLWLTQHFSARAEVRYQAYQDQIYTGSRDVNLVVSTVSVGFLL